MNINLKLCTPSLTALIFKINFHENNIPLNITTLSTTSTDTGCLAQMAFNNNSNGFNAPSGLGVPGAGFGGGRSRLNSKRLSVALPPKINSIDEHNVDNPTPRTSRSHLLAGLRTQPRTSAQPSSAPYNQTQHNVPGLAASRWAEAKNNSYEQGVPQSAMGNGFDMSSQYAPNAGRQMYSLPEQVLAPPSLNEHVDEMDPAVLQQMQMTSMYLAQRQQQLQQQLANITAAASGLTMNPDMAQHSFQQQNMVNQQGLYAQQQAQSPIEMPGQPGMYMVYNPAAQGYTYVYDSQQQQQQPQPQPYGYFNSTSAPGMPLSGTSTERSTPTNGRAFTPPRKVPTPPSNEAAVEPLPPPSANAFRRGHKKAPSSLSIQNNVSDGPKTASTAMFGSQRSVFPPTPMTGTFGPGGSRAGDHPVRQPRGPPPLEELAAAPTSLHEGSKNFAARQRRRALDNLMKAGIGRRGFSPSNNCSPISESDFGFAAPLDDDVVSFSSSNGSRKMSPIGSEMQGKRGSQGSADSYFSGLSSASSSEAEDMGAFGQPPTPASPVASPGDRKKMMMGVFHAATAAEKRRVGVEGAFC